MANRITSVQGAAIAGGEDRSSGAILSTVAGLPAFNGPELVPAYASRDAAAVVLWMSSNLPPQTFAEIARMISAPRFASAEDAAIAFTPEIAERHGFGIESPKARPAGSTRPGDLLFDLIHWDTGSEWEAVFRAGGGVSLSDGGMGEGDPFPSIELALEDLARSLADPAFREAAGFHIEADFPGSAEDRAEELREIGGIPPAARASYMRRNERGE